MISFDDLLSCLDSVSESASRPITPQVPVVVVADTIPSTPVEAKTTPVQATASPVEVELLPVPAGLKVTPWPHQVRGYSHCMKAISTYQTCLLAAEMGVGKTLIATMLALGTDSRRTLIVCPLRVIGSWKVQLAQYLGEDSVLTLLDDTMSVAKRVDKLKQDMELARLHNLRHWVVINYDSFWRDPISDVLASTEWGAIIYDEVHKTKSPGSKASMMARRLRPRGKVRILATGTPMAHSPLDAYGIMRAGNDQILGKSYIAFKQRYALWAGPNNRIRVGFQNIKELEEKLAPVTWRATKDEVLPDLPDKSDVDYETTLSPEAAKVYRNLEKNLISEINGNTLTAANILTKILRLQQICGGAVPDDDGKYHQIDDSKRKLLMDVIEDLGDKPFVVFCRFRSDIDAAHQACREMGVEAMELSGQYNQLERWQNGEEQALIVQMQSGSVGINLTRASTAIYYSLSTSLAEWDQSQARIHRPGQKNACTYIYLLIKGTVDMKILRALRSRLEVVTEIMNNIQQKHEESK